MVRAEDAEKFATLDALAGATIGAQSGTTGETYANEHKPQGATIKSFEDVDGLFGALTSGDIDAILQDYPANAFRAAKDDDFVVPARFPTGEKYGYAVKKGNEELLDFLNEELDALRESGEFDEIYESYFGEKET